MSAMDDLKFQNVVASRIREMVDYIETDIGKDRAQASRFYLGDTDAELKPVEGRSRAKSMDLRDAVNDALPSILRIFMQRKAVEYIPMSVEDVAGAEQATDYANHIIWQDNDGFRVLHSAIKDALYQFNGIVKCWWDEKEEVTANQFKGLDDETFQAVMLEVQGTDSEITEHAAEQTPEGMKHSVTIESRKKTSRVRMEATPPEEFIMHPDAKSITDTPGLGHKSYQYVGDLAAQGYDVDMLLEHAGDEDDIDSWDQKQARNPSDTSEGEETADDPAMRKVLHVEAYLRMDADGDGVVELRKVCTIGNAYKVVHHEIVDDHPFADFLIEPVPHRWKGECFFDLLKDLQLINTQLMRLHLDGLAQVVTPRMGALTGAGVDMRALLDNAIGGVVPMNRPDGVFPLNTDKAAPQIALESYRAMKEVRAERTGQSAATQGLEPDALQSVSRVASNALVQRAQGRLEMICRVLAETGFKRLMKIILRLITQYQDKERTVRLRNQWVPMDPRTWNPDMDVCVNVGLGTGNTEEKMGFLSSFLQVQQMVLQGMGPNNPLITMENVRNALEDMCDAAGKVSERYVMPKEEWAQMQQRMAQQPQPPQQPDPNMELVKVEREKNQGRMQLDAQRQQFDMQVELLKDDRERDKAEADMVMEAMKLGIPPEAALAFIRQNRVATPTQAM